VAALAWLGIALWPPPSGTAQGTVPDGMVYVPAGSFTMGSPEQVGEQDESPFHRVHLDDYWIGETEVTNAMYAACLRAGKCSPSAHHPDVLAVIFDEQLAQHPVVNIPWEEAERYCAWTGLRLPTEAEWEKAARGTYARTYPWGELIDCSRANYWGRGWACTGQTTEVGLYPLGASPYGALDMAGNVMEWVADWYDAAYYAHSPTSNPQGPVIGSYRVVRGGSWQSTDDLVRSAHRHFGPDGGSEYIGFRCALSP
jgi:formylglycine-generating enzyme required for sulfatase activity